MTSKNPSGAFSTELGNLRFPQLYFPRTQISFARHETRPAPKAIAQPRPCVWSISPHCLQLRNCSLNPCLTSASALPDLIVQAAARRHLQRTSSADMLAVEENDGLQPELTSCIMHRQIFASRKWYNYFHNYGRLGYISTQSRSKEGIGKHTSPAVS